MANKKIWTQAEINAVAATITRDWECEGALRWTGDTYKYYEKKKYDSDDEIDTYGEDTARMIKRYNACYTIEEIYERDKR